MEIPPPGLGWRAGLSVGLLAALLAWETFQPYFAFFGRDRKISGERLRHGAGNLALGIFNAVVVATLFAGGWLAVARWTDAHHFGLLPWLDLSDWPRRAVAVLLLDGWTYGWHRLNHQVPFLWRFHRLHHADRAMDVTTASRFHTGEIVLSSILRIPVLLGLGCRIGDLALYELLLFAVVQFHHANVALPEGVDRWLRQLIVTPSLHKVHHSIVREESDSNYSSLFPWWDRLFGSRRLLPAPQEIVFGVEK